MHNFKSYESSDFSTRYVNGRKVKSKAKKSQVSPNMDFRPATAVSFSDKGIEVTCRD
jgi:hypothetical protein